MTLTYGFYNSVDDDRLYDALQMSSLFDGLINDGVYGSIGDAFVITAAGGMNVNVGTGRAWFNHTWTYSDAVIVLSLSAAHPILSRYDAIILEVNEDVGTRANSIKVLTGTPSSDPQFPTLTNNSTLHQYMLGYILVQGGATQITQGRIYYTVGTNDCPLVTGIVSVLSTNDIVANWEAQFTEWFTDLQNQLDENQAANLQAQLYEHDHSEALSTPVVGIADDAVTELAILAGAVTTGKLADNAVDDTKVGNRVPQVYRRQGSSSSNWQEEGSSTQTPGAVRIQPGSMYWFDGDGANNGTMNITFPVAFSNVPLVYAQFIGSITVPVIWSISTISASAFTISWKTSTGANVTQVKFNWIAYGPE